MFTEGNAVMDLLRACPVRFCLPCCVANIAAGEEF